MKTRDYVIEIINILDKYSYQFTYKDYNKIISKLLTIENKFHEHSRIENEEIQSELKVILIEVLNKFKGIKTNERIFQFLNYLDKTLYNRLQDRTNRMVLTEEDDQNNYNINVESIGIPIERLNKKYVVESFEENLVENIMIDNFKNKLSQKESEVFLYIYELNYSQRKVAKVLNISRRTVRTYIKRIVKKFKKDVAQKHVQWRLLNYRNNYLLRRKIIEPRYTRNNIDKENREIKQKYKDKFAQIAKEENIDKNRIDTCIVSGEIIKSPHKHDNHNKYCGKKYKIRRWKPSPYFYVYISFVRVL